MFKGIAFLASISVVALATPSSLNAQTGYSDWIRYGTFDGVNIDYATRVDRDEIRVLWRCQNFNGYAISCSIGAGENKKYVCQKGTTRVGETGSLGERRTIEAQGEGTFPSDWACRGMAATGVSPVVKVSIER